VHQRNANDAVVWHLLRRQTIAPCFFFDLACRPDRAENGGAQIAASPDFGAEARLAALMRALCATLPRGLSFAFNRPAGPRKVCVVMDYAEFG